jgi:WD40 repeat protein
MFATANDSQAHLWDLDRTRPIAKLSLNAGPSSGLLQVLLGLSQVYDSPTPAFHPDGWLVAASHSTAVKLWTVEGHSLAGEVLRGHDGRVQALTFSSDGQMLASAARGEIRLWDVANRVSHGEPLHSHPDNIVHLEFAPDGTALLSLGDGNIRRWDLNRRPSAVTGPPPQSPITAALFSPDGATVVTADTDGSIHLRDPATLRPVGTPLPTGGGQINSLSFTADGRLLASAHNNGTVKIWTPKRA